MNSKEKYGEVYRTAIELHHSTNFLRKKSRRIYLWSILTSFFPGVLYAVLLLLLHYNCDCSSESKQTISLMTFFVTFLVMLLMQTRSFFRIGTLFHKVMEICGELSDMVDWTTMRKRQVYSEIDPKIQKPIDEFFEFSMSTQCPFYGGKTKYKFFRYLSMVEMIVVMVFSLLFTFGIIVI